MNPHKTLKLNKISHRQLKLSESEINKLGKITRDHKFDQRGIEMIYPNSDVDKLMFFIKSYRYLFNLINCSSASEKIDKELENILKKINKYLDYLDVYYIEACLLLNGVEQSVHFNKHKKKLKITNFVNKNRKIIDDVLDGVFPLGRVVKTYNPDEVGGYY